MGLSQSLFAGITGLKSHQTRMNVIGNNIANVNTVAFKASRVLFKDQISQLISPGSSPTGGVGGTDPSQFGLGTQVGTIQTDFSQGPLEPTGNVSDLAIDGRGFFVVQSGDTMRYTRDGAFRLGRANKTDSQGNLVVDEFGNPQTTQVLLSSSGWKVKGRKADAITGEPPNPSLSSLEDIEIPLGEKRKAKATSNAFFTGNLKGDGDVSYTGSTSVSISFFSDQAATVAAAVDTDLSTVYDASGNKLLENGVSIDVSANKGNQTIDDTFEYGSRSDQDGTTLADFAEWLRGFFGIATPSPGSDPGLDHSSDDGVNDNDGINEARVVFGRNAAGVQNSQNDSTQVGYGFWDGTGARPAWNTGVTTGAQFVIHDDVANFAGVNAGDEVYLQGTNIDAGFYTVAEVVDNNTVIFQGRGSSFYSDNTFYDNDGGFFAGATVGDTGITYDTNPNQFYIHSNLGLENGIGSVTFGSGGVNLSPFSGGQIQNGDGESVLASSVVFDSLGTSHQVDLRFVLVDKTNNQSTWRWYANSPHDEQYNPDLTALTTTSTDSDRVVGSGTVVFGADGQWVSETSDKIQIDYEYQGVTTRLIVDPNFKDVTQFASQVGSEVNVKEQDGVPMGVLEKFSVSQDGVITGVYTNGLTEKLAQIAIALFPNDHGLDKNGDNMFSVGANSGDPLILRPNTGSSGIIRSGVLEQSNVDLSKEFTDMIITQRGYQGNARVITTSDEMLLELVNLKR